MSSSQRSSRTALSRAAVDTVVSTTLNLRTAGANFLDLTPDIAAFVTEARAADGAVTCSCVTPRRR